MVKKREPKCLSVGQSFSRCVGGTAAGALAAVPPRWFPLLPKKSRSPYLVCTNAIIQLYRNAIIFPCCCYFDVAHACQPTITHGTQQHRFPLARAHATLSQEKRLNGSSLFYKFKNSTIIHLPVLSLQLLLRRDAQRVCGTQKTTVNEFLIYCILHNISSVVVEAST